MRWSALLHSLAFAFQSNGLQQEEILHGSFKGSRLLLIQAVDDVIAILGPEVKPEFRCFTCFEIFEYRNVQLTPKTSMLSLRLLCSQPFWSWLTLLAARLGSGNDGLSAQHFWSASTWIRYGRYGMCVHLSGISMDFPWIFWPVDIVDLVTIRAWGSTPSHSSTAILGSSWSKSEGPLCNCWLHPRHIHRMQ